MKPFLTFLFCFWGMLNTLQAQPSWGLDPDCSSITTDGVAAFTCGVSTDNPSTEDFTMGMMLINDVVPTTGRLDITSQIEMYHHPSWHVDTIGNVFGVTMDGCGNTYVTASANYPSGFFNHPSILKYGTLVGSENSLESAGAIYRIDAETGQASHFTSLPQQFTTVSHTSCLFDPQVNRNTGPGLGNIAYYAANEQFYVTNFEDGRIYRLDADGTILDSYDPLAYDNGQSGAPADLEDIPYGIAVSPDGSQLFFGTAEIIVFSFPESFLDPPARVYSVDLNADGSFVGTVNNSTLPAGATWSNFVGTDSIQFEVPLEFIGGIGFEETRIISDIEFLPSEEMFIGTRTICGYNIYSAYNHSSQAYVLEENGGSYSEVGELLPGVFGVFAGKECYGGVSYYENGSGEVDYVVTSADMLSGAGPHGIHVSDEDNFNTSGSITPAGIISYGGLSNNDDPKGIGGDVYVFRTCNCVACACVGDINGDGSIDLLDVDPFVALIIAGIFEACADINGDGEVNLLDVDPFVALLTSGATCGEAPPGNGGNSRGQEDTRMAIEQLYQRLGMEQPVADLQYFPNPASDVLNLTWNATSSARLTLRIYNTAGQQVLVKEVRTEAGPNWITVDLEDLTAGLYFVEVNDGQVIQGGKFLVEK